ncbi:MAG: DUF5615 family PIN-like protein, partial [Polyangiaceae bacterium]|nr:DUF5615 family PIN-like protein [Polyangiaceae bacterium]
RWNFQAIDGVPLRRWDDRDQIFRTQHDALRRPTHQYLKIGAAPETLLQRTLYGESHPTPEPNNLRGRPIRHYDEAGALKSESYDFKGNPLETQRRLALAFTAATDWTPLATATTPSAIDAAAAALLETETFTQTRSYDALNRIASATEPDLTEIKPSYNQRGLLDQVEARIRNAATWTTFVGDIQYDAKAQRQSIDYGNGTATAYEYDELTYRLLHLTTTRTAPSNTLQDLSYTFDPVGNIVAISDAAQQTLFYNNSVVLPQNLFEYDALYRLLSATGREHASIGDVQLDHNDLPLQNLPHNNDASAVRTYLEEYQYDAVGNILEMFHEAAGTPVATWTRAYTYAVGTNRLATNTIPGGTATYTHDAHGSITSMPHLAAIDWTPFDQIKTCDLGGGGDVYFTYSSDGARVRKVWQQTATAVKERIYLGAYEIYREKLSGVTQLERQTLHVMDGVQRIAMVETKTIEGGAPIATPAPKQRYQLGNHLGSAMLEVDDTGLIISYEEYAPYGTSAYRSARSGVEVSARRYRYTGKERDDETGLYYYGARYYAAWLGRWTSADPLGIGADGPGLYNYTRGSPVVFVDPSGLEGATPPLAPRVGLPSPPPPKAELEKAAPAKSARTTGPRPSNSSPAPTASATASSGGAASVLGNVLSGAAEEVGQKARDLARGVVEHPLQALQSATPLGAGAALITGAISSSTRIAETAMASATVASGDESQRQFGKLLVNLVELALTVAPFVKGGKTGKGSSSDPLGIADDIKVDFGSDPDFGLKPSFRTDHSNGRGPGPGAGDGTPQLLPLLRTRLLKQMGFADEGAPIILDENLSSRGTANALRSRGYNVRSVEEIFGRGAKDPTIRAAAEASGTRVLTRDRGRQPNEGFGEVGIQVDERVGTDINALSRYLDAQGVTKRKQ